MGETRSYLSAEHPTNLFFQKALMFTTKVYHLPNNFDNSNLLIKVILVAYKDVCKYPEYLTLIYSFTVHDWFAFTSLMFANNLNIRNEQIGFQKQESE